jgi:gliding motility-associated-like protein
LWLAALLIALPGWAQKEGNLWFFANNAGLDFNATPPQPRTEHQLRFGVAEPVIMADPCGNLLFYSNGGIVWNRDHQPMVNGEGLHGGTVLQSVIALPYPGRDSLYLLVTLNVKSDRPNPGLWYSVVDMRLDGGKGAVTVKNQFLRDPRANQLTAVRHANGRDFWVLTVQGGTSNFLAFPVTAGGISNNAVVTPLPFVMAIDSKMRASPDNRKVAMNVISGQRNANVLLWLDNATGQITRTYEFPTLAGGTFDFSPDSRKVYWRVFEGLFQYQLDAPDINATGYLIPGTEKTTGDVRLAPDGRLYMGHNATSLDVIINPNAAGDALQYQSRVQPIGNRMNGLLPNNLATFTIGKSTDFTAAPVCADAPVQFTPQVNYRVVQWQWDFGDPAAGETNTTDTQNPSHQFSGPGRYHVRLVTLDGCGERDTVHREVEVYPQPLADLPEDRVEKCFSEVPVTFSISKQPLTRYRWNTGDTTHTVTADQTGWYRVEAYNACGRSTDSVYLDVTPRAVAYLPDDTVVCEGNFALLDALNPGAEYFWSTGATTRQIQADRPGLYWVEIRNRCSVTVDSARLVFVREDAGGFIPNVFTPNGDGINDRFELYVRNTPAYRLIVANRWGNTLFTSRNPFQYWDGRTNSGEEVPAGVYYWAVTATDCRGNPVRYRGTISLLR